MKRFLSVLAVTAVIMLGVFHAAGWYADHSSLPRFCADSDRALSRVRDILSDHMAGYSRDKRGFIVASKLIFLVPQRDGESLDEYEARLRVEIGKTCI